VNRLVVSFVLPKADPARLELLDVGGRRILSREVGALGPGPHEVELGRAEEFPSGIYFVRLSQGIHTRVERAVVARMGSGSRVGSGARAVSGSR
jgi:hypothetical protein